ncbi:calcium-binding protein [Streptomyces sp. 4N509B]|uniref:calcium-binding protein n=1 Tax=Streptomyces sp. 4N509B TaxID=3457413 RepID=UPI003FD05D17
MRAVTLGAARRTAGRWPAVAAGLGLVALAGVGLGAPSAAADTGASAAIDQAAQTLRYVGGGTGNDVTITPGSDDVTAHIDDVVPIVAGEGCTHPDPADTTRVTCTFTASADETTSVVMHLGGGDDSGALFLVGDVSEIHGGAGNDSLAGGTVTTLYGDEGEDSLNGGGVAWGGDDDDTLRPSREAHGEAGNDTILANPDYTGVQHIVGGLGHDYVEAGPGDDVIYGNSGEDEVYGGIGNDWISGGPDADTLYGNSGDDYIRGGDGDDFISGGPGTNDVAQ